MEVELVVPRLLSVTGPTSEPGRKSGRGKGGKQVKSDMGRGLQGQVGQLLNLGGRAATVRLAGLCVTK